MSNLSLGKVQVMNGFSCASVIGGDVKESFADIDAIRNDLGFEPATPIDVGVPKFVEWFKSYHGIN